MASALQHLLQQPLLQGQTPRALLQAALTRSLLRSSCSLQSCLRPKRFLWPCSTTSNSWALLFGIYSQQLGLRPSFCWLLNLSAGTCRRFCSASAPLPSELGDRHKNSSLQINNICSTASALQHLLQQPLLQGLAHYSQAFGPPFARMNWRYRLYSCLYIQIRLHWFCSTSVPLPSDLGDRHKNSSLQIS